MEVVQEISKIVGITNEKVISQAMEYLRLLKLKTNYGIKNECPRIVICLDISATKADENINADKGRQLIKYGAVKYRNEKNTILRILGLMEAPNIKSICIALEVTRIADVERNASLFLDKLKKCKSNLLGDVDHPQNFCMAVYHSCKLLAIKVNERKLITLSRLQRKQWTQLKMLWQPWLNERAWSTVPTDSQISTKNKSKKVIPVAPAHFNDYQPCLIPAIESDNNESFEVWKKRILAKAYADLALLKRKPKRCLRNTKK